MIYSLFKLAQGEYIAPDKIERIICRNPYIAQVYVEGSSLKSSLVAIIVPDREALIPWARQESILHDSFEELCDDPRVKKFLMEQIIGLGSMGTQELKGFEVPKAIHVEAKEFTQVNGLLTPTLKFKRETAKKIYEKQIGKMYARLKE